MADERLQYLFDRYLSRQCTPEERQELALLCLLPENQAALDKLLVSAWEQTHSDRDMPVEKGNLILSQILYPSVQQAIGPARIRRINWRRIAVAASVLFVLAFGTYFLFFSKINQSKHIVETPTKSNDVAAPTTNKAIITLVDGRKIVLDSISSGTLAVQSQTTVVKNADGEIVYQVKNENISGEIQYNTLFNPRGSRVASLTLADGTRVWLNSETSLRYFTSVGNSERKVEVNGEAYFEVAKDTNHKFVVTANGVTTEVLGTHFNVNNYSGEKNIRITLLEGSVRVSKNNASKILEPGEQVQVAETVRVEKEVDIEAVMAWKNGRFQFEGAGIEEVMRQIARWYDVEVVYEVEPGNQHFRGGISRNVEVSKVFGMLEATEAVHFRIEGKKVFVIK